MRDDTTVEASMSYGRQQRMNWARGRVGALFAKRSVRPGEHFGAPGQGSAAAIATGTVVALLLLWVAVSNSGLVKPLFLPTPQAVFGKFVQVATEGFAGATLLEHTLTSLVRVFGAFALACARRSRSAC